MSEEPAAEAAREPLIVLIAKLEKAQAESRKWQIAAILLPVLATALLGATVDRWKASINETIDRRTKELSTRLALTEEFYKRKLTVHETLYRQTVDVVNSLKDARFNKEKKAAVVNHLALLYQNYTANGLYISPDLLKLLKQFDDAAANTPVLYPKGTVGMPEVEAAFARAQEQMIKDLQFGQLNTVP